MKILNMVDSKNRTYTEFGHLKVDNCILTCEGIQEYGGDELPDANFIDKNKMYKIYRPLAEIKKNLDSYNNVPLTDEHHFVDGVAVHKDKWLGGVGTNAYIKDGKLYNSIAVWDTDGVELLEKHKQDLSAGYSFNLVNKSGDFDGQHYDFIMDDIKCNHIALVKNGRVPEAKVADKKYLGGQVMATLKDAVNTITNALGLDKKTKDNDDLENEIEDGEVDKQSTSSAKASTKDKKAKDEDDKDDKKDDKVVDKKAKDNDMDTDIEDEDEDKDDKKPAKAGDSEVTINLIKSEKSRIADAQLMDQAIENKVNEILGSRIKAKTLCEDALGGISAFDGSTSIDIMYTETLKALGHDSKEIKSYSLDTKEALLKHEVSSAHKQKQVNLKSAYIADSADEKYVHLI